MLARFVRRRAPAFLNRLSFPSSSAEFFSPSLRPLCLNSPKGSLHLDRRAYFASAEQTAEMEFHQRADETLHHLTDFFDSLPDRFPTHPDYDVTLAMGVLTVVVEPDSIYVINKQTPNRQIWLSSPISGPKRYDWSNGAWVYSHDGVTLHSLLEAEFARRYGVEKIGIDGLPCE